jgi:ribosomal protein S18 acetylase RimI-like enzyme
LVRLFESTHPDLAGLPKALVEMQIRAQRAQYAASYPSASREIVLIDNVPAGNLVLDRSPEEIRVVDVGLLPEFRGRGIGSSLISDLIKEGKPIRLNVAIGNPAHRLYQRLGFVEVGASSMHLEMHHPG